MVYPPSSPHPNVHFNQDVGNEGLSLGVVAFMTVLTVLAVLESTLRSCRLSYKKFSTKKQP